MGSSTSKNLSYAEFEEQLALAADLIHFRKDHHSAVELVENQLIPGARAEIEEYGEEDFVTNFNCTGRYRMITVINQGLRIAREIDETGTFEIKAA